MSNPTQIRQHPENLVDSAPGMNVVSIKAEHLTIHRVEPLEPGPDVLVIGNAYGVLPYQTELARCLSLRGFRPWWWAFSGQNGTSGSFCLESGVRDIGLGLEVIRSESQRNTAINVVTHCAGTMGITEFMCRKGCADVRRMIVYGLLFSPARRRSFAEPLMRRCGVNQTIEDYTWNYPWLEKLPQLDIPLLLCHARDSLNLQRATETEIQTAAAAAKNAELRWFEKGYDRETERVSAFADSYASWLKGNL